MWTEVRKGIRNFWPWFRGLSTWGQVLGWVIFGLLALVVFGAIIGEDESADKTRQAGKTETTTTQAAQKPEPKPKAKPTNTATNANVRRIVDAKLDEHKTRKVECFDGFCQIDYKPADAPPSYVDEVWLEDQFDAWKELFKLKGFDGAKMTAYADLVSQGGKESVGRLLGLVCNRTDNRQIDWGNVTTDGIKHVCLYREYAKGT